jgi:transcriptional regulator with XRE-family HTH domain
MQGWSQDRLSAYGNRVRQRRVEENLSQEALSCQVGISRVYLSQIERGLATNLSLEIVNKLCERLGLHLGDVDGSDELPAGLAALRKKLKLPEADVKMLLAVQYRGKTPHTVEQWETIYNIIAATSKTWG